MIDQDKLKNMTQLALYEKKKGKKDLAAYSFDQDDYIRFQMLKTFVLVAMAFVALVGLIALWNLNSLISRFDTLNYKLLLLLLCGGFLLFMVIYLILCYRQSKDEYNRMIPRIRRYQRGLNKMKKFYMIEDKQQRDFEKGEWRNG